MAKNRSYKVQSDFYNIPYVTIKGKFLEKLGFVAGSHWEVIETDSLLIWRKQTDNEISLKEFSSLRTTYKRLFNLCERHLETYYSYEFVNCKEHETVLRHLNECGKIIITLQALALNQNGKANVLEIMDEYKRKLAFCEQSFLEYGNTVLMNVDLDIYKHLLTLLKDCGQHLGIFTKRKLFSFKSKRQVISHNGRTITYPHNVSPLMIAEKHGTYSIEEELAKYPEKYNQIQGGTR